MTERKQLKQVKLNLHLEDHLKIKEEALKLNMTMANYVRNLLNIKIVNKNGLTKYEEEKIRQLKKIGNNINQIAKTLNTEKAELNDFVSYLYSLQTLLQEKF